MNFRTTSTIGEQMSHVKKYAPLLLLKTHLIKQDIDIINVK